MLKRIFKAVFYFLLLFFAIILVVILAGYIRGDDRPDPVVDAFYERGPQDYATDNGAVAMLGLAAPADVNDSYAWALKIIESQLARQKEFTEKYANRRDWNFINAMLEGNTEAGMAMYIQGWDNIPNKTSFKGSNRPTNCLGANHWFYANGVKDESPCNPEAALMQLVQDNTLMLTRYEKALTHQRYLDLTQASGAKAQTIINMQELYAAHLMQLSKTDRAAALKKWMANIAFYKRALASEITLIERSVLMVNYSIIQRALPTILAEDEALAEHFQQELLAALTPMGPKDCRFDLTMKAEHQIMGPIIDRLGNAQRNKMYRFQQDFIQAWNMPASQSSQAWDAFHARYDMDGMGGLLHAEDWHSPLSGMLTNMILGGMAAGGDLGKAMHVNDARARILTLYVQMVAAGTPPEAIADFIKAAPEALQDPFTKTPFEYDTVKQIIYLSPPGGIRQGLLLNPKKDNADG